MRLLSTLELLFLDIDDIISIDIDVDCLANLKNSINSFKFIISIERKLLVVKSVEEFNAFLFTIKFFNN